MLHSSFPSLTSTRLCSGATTFPYPCLQRSLNGKEMDRNEEIPDPQSNLISCASFRFRALREGGWVGKPIAPIAQCMFKSTQAL